METTVRLANTAEQLSGSKKLPTSSKPQNHKKSSQDHFIVTSGDDEVALPMTAVGGDGVISVMANALPKAFSQMINFALDQDYYAAGN
ncbi:MAG: dihydrodipicolinate synthase family protein [Saprospiraceae bacterium]|nr:dihydrodipicolinate synthase family protein [Saprospiraceae bacterium]